MLAYMGVSLNGGTPKSSILIGISIINHPFWGTPYFGNTHMFCSTFPPHFFTVFSGVFAHSDDSIWIPLGEMSKHLKIVLLGLQNPCPRYVWMTVRGIGGVCRLKNIT